MELMAILGNACARCKTQENLTFDCIQAQGDRHHKIDTSARMSFYRKQHATGNLQILCDACNTAKSVNERNPQDDEQNPF